MGLPHGASRSLLKEWRAHPSGCHGLAPWSFTFAAKRVASTSFRMPWACPMESHVELSLRVNLSEAAIMRLHGSSPWHLRKLSSCWPLVAAIVRLHGSSPWHLHKLSSVLQSCSSQREAPRLKPVASAKRACYSRFTVHGSYLSISASSLLARS
jgi:hypothetical protein